TFIERFTARPDTPVYPVATFLRACIGDDEQAAEREEYFAIGLRRIHGADGFEVLGREAIALRVRSEGIEERPHARTFVPLDDRFGAVHDVDVLCRPNIESGRVGCEYVVVKSGVMREPLPHMPFEWEMFCHFTHGLVCGTIPVPGDLHGEGA